MPLTPERQAYRLRVFRATYDWLTDALPESQPRRLLEVGAGRHGWAALYQEHFEEVIALDLTDFSEDNPGVEYLVGDITRPLPISEQSFDIAVSHSVLEHIRDLNGALDNISRALKIGGYAFLTVAPLYYSAQGAHMRYRSIERWEHLDPEHPDHLTDTPFPNDPDGGHFLNRMTWSDMLAAVGRQPWEIMKTKVMIDHQPFPSWLPGPYTGMDLRCRGFFLLARKIAHLG